jgi:hypothetical protein
MRPSFTSLLERLDHGHHVLRVYCKDMLAVEAFGDPHAEDLSGLIGSQAE